MTKWRWHPDDEGLAIATLTSLVAAVIWSFGPLIFHGYISEWGLLAFVVALVTGAVWAKRAGDRAARNRPDQERIP